MIRHLVLFRLRDGVTEAQAAELRSRLTALRELPGVRLLQVAADVVGGADHWDLALVVDFSDRDALDAYQTHPIHRAAVDWMDALVAGRAIADIPFASAVGSGDE